MTQIRPLSQPVRRRPGELGVHSLDRFQFAVPDLDAGRKFYASFGLDVRAAGNTLDIHTHGHPHRWGSVVEGPRKQLQFISFGAFEEDLPRFRERLERLRIARRDPPPGLESNGIWLRDPDGTAIEIRVAEKTSPNAKSSFDNASAGPGLPGAPAAAGCMWCGRAGSPISWSSPATSRKPSSSTARSWGCGCPTARAT